MDGAPLPRLAAPVIGRGLIAAKLFNPKALRTANVLFEKRRSRSVLRGVAGMAESLPRAWDGPRASPSTHTALGQGPRLLVRERPVSAKIDQRRHSETRRGAPTRRRRRGEV